MTELKPLRRAAGAVLRVAPGLAPQVEKAMWRSFYELASTRRGELGTMMNYGYAPLEDADAAADGVASFDDERSYGLQLYAAVAGAYDVSGKDVLEVGCGRGGGTHFVFERFAPSSMTGLDLARRAIDRCRRRYGRPGLQFVAGDAEDLPFPDGSFDVVLSVESSHCYAHPARFWSEAHRVLRPGGRLLLADARHAVLAQGNGALFAQDDIDQWREQLVAAGFRIDEEQEITPNVVRALQLDTPARIARIERTIPKFLQPHVVAFAAVEGSAMYQAFAESRLIYLRFVLAKVS